MKVVIIYNEDLNGVIHRFGIQNREVYNPKTIQLVLNALRNAGHSVHLVDGNMNIVEILKLLFPRPVDDNHIGIVFNMAYGIQGESRYTHVPAMLEMLGIPYVGSSPSGHALALDKVLTKVLLMHNEIPTPAFKVFSNEDEDLSGISYPMIVKPKMESVSFGISVVKNENELKTAIKNIREEYQQQVLVEEFIRGREFAVGLLGNGESIEAFPIVEIDLNNNPDEIQTAEDKKFKPRKKICPADLPAEVAEKLIFYSKKAFDSLQLRDFARVDFRVDLNGNVYVLEINSMASLGLNGSFVASAAALGYDYNILVNKILQVAHLRYFGKQPEKTNPDLNNKKDLIIQMRTQIYKHFDIYEELLEAITNINTHRGNILAFNELLKLVLTEVKPLGFKSYNQKHSTDVFYIANHKDQNTDILFLINTDNRIENSQFQVFSKSGNIYSGTGIWQNKGGILVLIMALQSLASVTDLNKHKIGILFLASDELKKESSKSIIAEKTRNAKCVIGLHGASSDYGVYLSQQGMALYNLELKLNAAESNLNSDKLALAFAHFKKSLSKIIATNFPEIILNKSHFESRFSASVAQGQIHIGIRFNHEEQLKKAQKELRKLMKKRLAPQIYSLLELIEMRPTWLFTKYSETFFKNIKEISIFCDTPIKIEQGQYASSICYLAENKNIIDGMGPIGKYSLENPESIIKHSVKEKAILLSMLILQASTRNLVN